MKGALDRAPFLFAYPPSPVRHPARPPVRPSARLPLRHRFRAGMNVPLLLFRIPPPSEVTMKLIGLLALTLGFAAGCGSEDPPAGPGPGAPDAITVTTGSAPPPRFIPQSGSIAVGGTVTFRNGSPVEHNVKSGTNVWALRALQPDEAFDVTFTEAGQYTFECTIHPGMTGVIVVQ